MIWYYNFPPNAIDSFTMLADSFVKAYVRAIKVEIRKSKLFKVKQEDNEILREFVSRFQMECMYLPPVADDWAVQAFTQGLNVRSSVNSQQLKQNLIKYPAVTWADVHNRRNDRGQSSRGLMSKSGFDRNVEPNEAPRLLEYNFNVDASAIVSSIGRIKDNRWPRPLQTDPVQRNLNQMCKYHGTHGHKTEDCRQLREKVARLFNEGHLREFLSDRAKNHFRNRDSNKQNEQDEPQHVIYMIVGGVDIPQRPVFNLTKVSITREKWTRDYVLEGTMSFNDEDANGILQPHNNALVNETFEVREDQMQRYLDKLQFDPGLEKQIRRVFKEWETLIRPKRVESFAHKGSTIHPIRRWNVVQKDVRWSISDMSGTGRYRIRPKGGPRGHLREPFWCRIIGPQSDQSRILLDRHG
uniref:Retrotransposon gag domain-containing protein n=1 Tax=Nicotiana tabacum TaxID=4097 RepID=A0A1S4C3J5_TOBAC|nr:PREDICTED: uncharacterized protein LOC107814802 [Nicotiana tabacum]